MREIYTKNKTFIKNTALLCVIFALLSIFIEAQGNFIGKIDRPLRYRPENKDFVIENGKEFFNRPLYGGNTAFRVDAGDEPEFSLYLPGRGGNLRFGIETNAGRKWLFDADKITTRYRPGAMIYEIRDSLIGKGVLKLEVLAMYQTEGVIVRTALENAAAPVEIFWAYGGANGERGRRDGDIGTERVPMSEFFQLKPEYCRDGRFSIEANNFTLESRTAKIVGLMPQDAKLFVADAHDWNKLDELLKYVNQPIETPVIVGRKTLRPNESAFFALQRIASSVKTSAEKTNETLQNSDAQNLLPAFKTEDLPQIFDDAEKRRESIADRVSADTPDAFVNAAAAALNVAGDAVWDERQSAFMRGASNFWAGADHTWATTSAGIRGCGGIWNIGRRDKIIRRFPMNLSNKMRR